MLKSSGITRLKKTKRNLKKRPKTKKTRILEQLLLSLEINNGASFLLLTITFKTKLKIKTLEIKLISKLLSPRNHF